MHSITNNLPTRNLSRYFRRLENEIYKKDHVTVATMLVAIPFSNDGKKLITEYLSLQYPEQPIKFLSPKDILNFSDLNCSEIFSIINNIAYNKMRHKILNSFKYDEIINYRNLAPNMTSEEKDNKRSEFISSKNLDYKFSKMELSSFFSTIDCILDDFDTNTGFFPPNHISYEHLIIVVDTPNFDIDLDYYYQIKWAIKDGLGELHIITRCPNNKLNAEIISERGITNYLINTAVNEIEK